MNENKIKRQARWLNGQEMSERRINEQAGESGVVRRCKRPKRKACKRKQVDTSRIEDRAPSAKLNPKLTEEPTKD